MKRKKSFLGKLLLVASLIFALNMPMAKTSYAAYEDDITPPTGKLAVESSEGLNITLGIYATDDMCKSEEIMYYISENKIENTARIDSGWKAYKEGAKETFVRSTNEALKYYIVFKDAAGNTSLDFEGGNTEYTVAYNANFDGATAANLPTGMNTKGYFGAPFGIDRNMPTREGYYFWGWSTDAGASAPGYYPGEILPAYLFTGANTSIPLYAIWTKDIEKLATLSNTVKIGDYVNYPVHYTNVNSDGTSLKSTYMGWRVIGIEDDGTVNLVSAGVPLTYYQDGDGTNSESILTNSFTSIPVTSTSNVASNFKQTGFGRYASLEKAFSNNFTTGVRAMTEDDVFEVTKASQMLADTEMDLANAKYANLLATGANYYLATANTSDTNSLWSISSTGNVSAGNSVESGVRPVVSINPQTRALGKDTQGAWKIDILQFEVTFNADGGEGTMKTVKLLDGTEYTLPECKFTAPRGFDFEAWEVNGVTKNVGDVITVTADTEIKVVWDQYIGDYIDYGVDYTDVYTNYEFSGDWAWRILSKEDNEDGTSNLEIISTGVPAQLNYYFEDIDYAKWCATAEQRAEYDGDYYISSSVDNLNVKAAAGLLYNFEKIEFSQGTGYPENNKGLYTAISGNQDTGSGLFKSAKHADKQLKVRSVMHADLKPGNMHTDVTSYTDLATGLFTLQNLAINPHTSGYYWLASPNSGDTMTLCYVRYNGSVYSDIGGKGSVRPVVSISNVQVENDNGVWRIK